MELYQTDSAVEKRICDKADLLKTPIGGTIELLPLCNMRCKMCYVYKSREEMEANGRILSAEEWIAIAEQGVKEGLLFLLLTGGEPLLYPEFKKLYQGLQRLGLFINTNATLIDEEWAKFFHDNGCRRLSITLYGKDDATYERLCGNPKGFTQVMGALELLKKYEVPFRLTCSVTPDNMDQIEELTAVAKGFDVDFVPVTYMFPGIRREKDADTQYRMTPELSAAKNIESFYYNNPNVDMDATCRMTLAQMDFPPTLKCTEGFSCKAGHSGFWLNWKGEMMICGMFDEPAYSLREYSFREAWKQIVAFGQNAPKCQECLDCDKQNICGVCPASCLAETGRLDGRPLYQCQVTDEKIRLMKEMIDRG